MFICPLDYVYVGYASCFRNRVNGHKSGSREKNKDGTWKITNRWKEAIRYHGWENLRVIILEYVPDGVSMREREQYWIDRMQADNPDFGYNSNGGGGGRAPGWTHSAETRAKISAAIKGNNHMKGRKHTAEERALMSRRVCEYYENQTEEQKEEQRQRNYQIAKSQMKAVIATQKSTGIKRKFESAYSAARNLSIEFGKKFNRSQICNCVNKRPCFNSHKGWTFEFEE